MAKKENFQEQDEIHEVDNVSSEFTCEICIEPARSIKNFSNSTLCRHPFCLDCIAKYIAARVEDGAAAAINCPALNCNHQLDPLSCQPVLPTDLFIKWCDRLCESAVSEIDKCYCPHTTCSTLILNECGNRVKKVNCPNCKKNFCFKCRIPWHAGYWCSETEQLRDNNDILFGKLLEQRKWIRCYKCGQTIEKNGGCSFIRCRCGSTICHLCGKSGHLLKTCENKCSWDGIGRIFEYVLYLAFFVVCYILFLKLVLGKNILII